MMKKESDSSCSTVLIYTGLVLLAIATWKTVQFFQKPDASRIIGNTLLDLLKSAGICLGAAVLLFGGFVLVGIFSNRLVRLSRDYSLRCYPVEMQTPTTYPISPDLPEAPGQETVYPLFLQAALTNYGLRLLPHPPRPGWKWFPADPAALFQQLGTGAVNRVIIPFHSLYLYYRLGSRQGDLVTYLAPADAPGYSGELPVDSTGQDVEIVLIYALMCDTKNLYLTAARPQPLKLRLTALDANGQDDPAATRQLYNALWEKTKPTPPNPEDDDSWMYRSRPWLGW